MARNQRAPWPCDIRLNGVGYMLERDQSGQPLERVETPENIGQGWKAKGEQDTSFTDFSGGMGNRYDDGSPESRKTLYYSSPDIPNLTTGQYGGCVDPSFGPIILGPHINWVRTTALANKTVRAFAIFNGLYWAAAGTHLYYSVTGTFEDAAEWGAGWFTSNIVDLLVWQGTASNLRLYILQQYGPIYTMDANAYGAGQPDIDGDTTGRNTAALAVYTTNDGGTTYLDNTGITMDLGNYNATGSPIHNLAGGGWVLVGFDRPFTGMNWQPVLTNSTAIVMAGEYWNGTAWTTLPGFTDNTASAGASLARNGTITWTRPNANWQKAIVTNNSAVQAAAYYFVRISWSASPDSTTTVNVVTVNYAQEAQAISATGKRLQIAWDHNRIAWAEDGGITPTWNESSDPIGPYPGAIIGLQTANDTAFLFRTTDFGSVNEDGTAVSYLPDLNKNPITTGADGQAYTSWLNKLYFSGGPNSTFLSFDPVTGDVAPVGPERLMVNDEMQFRITSCIGDRSHFLYAAGVDTAGNVWLLKWGAYRRIQDQNGILEDVRLDSWNIVAYLGSSIVTAMATYNLSVSGVSTPFLLCGCTNGDIFYCRLPLAVSPLDANSASNYQFTTTPAYVYFPAITGPEASRTTTLYAVTVIATRSDKATGTQALGLGTKLDGPSTTWTTQGAIGVDSTSQGYRVALPTPTVMYLTDVRLSLSTDSTTTTPIVLGLTLHALGAPLDRDVVTVTILCDDGVLDAQGRVIPRTAKDWRTLLDTVWTTRTPMSLTLRNGTTLKVLAQQQTQQAMEGGTRRSRKAVRTLVLSESD